jgi:acetate---CoA ligase (ADP-forming)
LVVDSKTQIFILNRYNKKPSIPFPKVHSYLPKLREGPFRMDRFFDAKSIVVVGVSDSPENLGRAIVLNLLEFRYTGTVYVVGPKGGSFLGHKIYRTIEDLPEAAELAVILIPAAAVPGALRQCGEKGVARVVLESGGFGELGPQGNELEQEVRAILKQHGMRMIGPNGLGIMNRRNGLVVPFMPLRAEARLGRVAVIAQSGGVGVMMINTLAAMNLGFCKFASIGNKLDVNEADLVEYLVRDDETGIVYCYLESIADGRRLMEIASRSPKPVIIHKSNLGRSGAVIARSHSASLASDDRVVDAAFRQSGIIRTHEQQETVEILKSFALPPMRGNRLAIISRSGGHAVMAADAAEEFGFELPPFPDDAMVRVRERSRARVIDFHNPLDLGDLFDLSLYRDLAEMTLAREDIDGLVFIHNYQEDLDANGSHRLIASLAELLETGRKPIGICVFTTEEELRLNQKANKAPLFTDPKEAVRSLARSRDCRQRQSGPFSETRPEQLDGERARLALADASTGPIPPERLASILSDYGIPLVPWKLAEDENDTVEAAREMGFPVVLKTAAPEVIHKSDEGGVVLDLADENAVRAAYGRLLRFGPRVLVQKMAEPGLEWLVGGRQDPNFGPVVVVGLGGIYVEVFKETVIRVAPIDYEEAKRMVEECRGALLLHGVRGQPPLDFQSLLEVIVRVSWLLADQPKIRELDLNPLRIFTQGCLALDWRAAVAGGS